MHRALEVAELVEIIAAYTPRSTLQSWCQTSYHFYDFLLPLVWRTVDHYALVHLLRGLEASNDADRHCQPDTALERFAKHASLVRELDLRGREWYMRTTIPTSILHFVMIGPQAPILPHLRILRAVASSVQDLRAYSSLLVSSLEVLDIRCSADSTSGETRLDWDEDTNLFLGRAVEIAMNLETFRFIGHWYEEATYVRALGGVLSQAVSLKTFQSDLSVLDPVVLPQLAAVQKLKTWIIEEPRRYTIDDTNRATMNITKSISREKSFSSLERLVVEGDILCMTALLQHLTSPISQLDLTLFSMNQFTPSQLEESMDAAATFSETIRTVYVRFAEYGPRLRDPCVWSFPKSLLPCSGMKMFTILWDAPRPLEGIVDEDFRALSVAWRSLEELSIRSAYKLQTSAVTGMTGLASLGSNCPRLRDLHLSSLLVPSPLSYPRPSMPVNVEDVLITIDHGFLGEAEVVPLVHYLLALWPKAALSHDRLCAASSLDALWPLICSTFQSCQKAQKMSA